MTNAAILRYISIFMRFCGISPEHHPANIIVFQYNISMLSLLLINIRIDKHRKIAAYSRKNRDTPHNPEIRVLQKKVELARNACKYFCKVC